MEQIMQYVVLVDFVHLVHICHINAIQELTLHQQPQPPLERKIALYALLEVHAHNME